MPSPIIEHLDMAFQHVYHQRKRRPPNDDIWDLAFAPDVYQY